MQEREKIYVNLRRTIDLLGMHIDKPHSHTIPLTSDTGRVKK